MRDYLELGSTEIRIDSLITYPVKSLPGISRAEVEITENGLAGDRIFTLADTTKLGDIAKRLTLREYPELAQISTGYVDNGVQLVAPDGTEIILPCDITDGDHVQVKSWGGPVDGIHISNDADAWLSDFLKKDAQILAVPDENRRKIAEGERKNNAMEYTGRATDGYPLHIASLASLRQLNIHRARHALPEVSIEQFRPNIVLEGDDLVPFAEDTWEAIALEGKERIIEILSIRMCERCVTIEVTPSSGEKRHDVLKTLSDVRNERSSKTKLVFGQWAAPARSSVGETLYANRQITIL